MAKPNPTAVIDKNCPLAETSKIIGDYWNILILSVLKTGPHRFNELLETIESATSATLSLKLKQLAREDIVERRQYECIPPRVEYSLTAKGEKFVKVIKEVERLSRTL